MCKLTRHIILAIHFSLFTLHFSLFSQTPWKTPSDPSRDIRPHSEYGTAEGELRLKYEFYHDMWSERDVKHGKYSVWSSNDRLTEQGFYFDDLQDSLWQYWYLNGKRKEVSWWEGGSRHGKTTLYDKEGKLTQEVNYQNGQQEGLTILYHTNGKVKEIAQYQNGHLHGNVTTYTRKGIRKRIHQYQEGRKQRGAGLRPDADRHGASGAAKNPNPEKESKPAKEPKQSKDPSPNKNPSPQKQDTKNLQKTPIKKQPEQTPKKDEKARSTQLSKELLDSQLQTRTAPGQGTTQPWEHTTNPTQKQP